MSSDNHLIKYISICKRLGLREVDVEFPEQHKMLFLIPFLMHPQVTLLAAEIDLIFCKFKDSFQISCKLFLNLFCNQGLCSDSS